MLNERRSFVGLSLALACLLGAATHLAAAEPPPLPEKQAGCWGDVGADGQAKMPKVALDGEDVPLVLSSECVKVEGDAATFAVPSTRNEKTPALLEYQRVWNAAKTESWFELKAAETVFQANYVSAIRITCEDFDRLLPGACEPTNILSNCWRCAIVTNNCWRNCGDPARCSRYENRFPPRGQRGTNCPLDRCRYVSRPCLNATAATDVRDFTALDEILTSVQETQQ